MREGSRSQSGGFHGEWEGAVLVLALSVTWCLIIGKSLDLNFFIIMQKYTPSWRVFVK